MNNQKTHILLVDDEPDILEILGYNLSAEGFKISKAENGKEALEIAKKEVPNLILLDVMMPEMDGMETCEEIRKIPKLNNTIIAFLTARGEDYSQMAGLDAGADDYLTKPVKPKVLVSKVNSLLRRLKATAEQEQIIKFDNLTIDRGQYKVIKGKKEINLPRKEFELLSLLASKPGKVFHREKILKNVWGEGVVVGDRTIDVHIRKLREKIGDEKFETVKGVGYKFVA